LQGDLQGNLSEASSETEEDLAGGQGGFAGDVGVADVGEVDGEAVGEGYHDAAEDHERFGVFDEADSDADDEAAEVEGDAAGVAG
jgi:hypothetical protein